MYLRQTYHSKTITIKNVYFLRSPLVHYASLDTIFSGMWICKKKTIYHCLYTIYIYTCIC